MMRVKVTLINSGNAPILLVGIDDFAIPNSTPHSCRAFADHPGGSYIGHPLVPADDGDSFPVVSAPGVLTTISLKFPIEPDAINGKPVLVDAGTRDEQYQLTYCLIGHFADAHGANYDPTLDDYRLTLWIVHGHALGYGAGLQFVQAF
jgi:hypothetical protein